MPNWCENILFIEGNKEDMKELLNLTTKEFDFDRIVPMPEHQEGIFFRNGGLGPQEQETYGSNNWYDWSNNNWGTKWNSHDVNFYCWENEDSMIYDINFSTAWSPPIPIIDALMFKFPKLDFTLTYKEMGSLFGGEYGTNGDIQFTEEEILIEDIQEWPDYYLTSIDDTPEDYTTDNWMDLYYKAGNEEVIKHAEKTKKAVMV